MKVFIVVCVFACLAASLVTADPRGFTRVDQFGLLILLVTGRNPFIFNGYGRYCGAGNDGGEPVDAIDACCAAHDLCWTNVPCPPNGGYYLAYEYSVGADRSVTCEPNQRTCRKELCECDLTAATCFRDNIDVYDPNNRN